MPYPMHRRLKPGRLTDEEVSVRDALHEYDFEPENSTLEDFVPTLTMYRKYCEYMIYGPGGDSVMILTKPQFGLALQRVFGVELERKFRRRVGGKLMYG